MELTIGDIPDYSNKIVIPTASQDLDLNDGVNAMPVQPKHTQPVKEPKQNNLCLKIHSYPNKD